MEFLLIESDSQKKICKKHHRVFGILVENFPFLEYTKIVDKYIAKSIFKYFCATYEGN